MALIITAGGDGATAQHTATGDTEVIASGVFGRGNVDLLVQHGSTQPALVHTFKAAGAVVLRTADGAVITATVRATSDASTAIDVSANP